MLRQLFLSLVAGTVLLCLLSNIASASIVWTGPTITFSKASNADFTFPANQDKLTNNVILTRGNTMGMFNIAQEISFNTSISPKDTQWATDLNNPSQTITATNFTALSFTTWTAAYNNSVGTNIIGRNAVVHLVTDDIYLNLKFTAFQGGGTGGQFTYERSTVPEASSFLLALIGLATLRGLATVKSRIAAWQQFS